MKQISWVIAMVLGFTLMVGAPVRAAKHGDSDGTYHKNKSNMIFSLAMKNLDLTDQQKSRLRDRYFEWSMKRIDLKAQKKKDHLRLKHLIHQGDASREQVHEQIERLYQSKAEMKKAKVNFMFDLRDMLGDKHWQKLMEMKHRHHRMMNHHGKHGHERKHGEDHGKKTYHHEKQGERDHGSNHH